MALNNINKYAIQGMIANDVPVAKIAVILGISEKTVTKYVDGLEDKKPDRGIDKVKKRPAIRLPKPISNNSGATIMTKEAGEVADELLKNMKTKRYAKCTTAIRKE